MKLYFSPGACSLSPHIVLKELGLAYEPIKVDLRNKDAEFTKKNPKGYVPALWTDNDQLMTEGAVIVQYLADMKPDSGMLPKMGTWERYRAMEMLNFISTEIHKSFSPLWALPHVFGEDKKAAETFRNHVVSNLGKRFDILESGLTGRKFLFGDQFTACDAYLFTVLNWTKVHKIEMAKWPNLMGYMERVQSRPNVQAAMKAEGLI